MKNILVVVENYPNNKGGISLMYVHTRNKAYIDKGINLTVLNFRTNENYIYDDIHVISLDSYVAEKQKYQILICHAANIRHHYRFLKMYGKYFENYVFFFHGHEVLRKSTLYPKLFSWKKQSSKIAVILRDIYDFIKLRIWKLYFESKNTIDKTELIFVSNWMLNEFLKNTHTDYEIIKEHVHIIYNSVGKIFEDNKYHPINPKYDFVTIRSNIDGEKYCVDVVNELAKNNPQYSFLVIGRGELFSHIKKADNLIWEDRNLQHNEILEVLDNSRYALMPTKTDAQGLMMCEMATYGMPVITSDIAVCHEVLDDFDNVVFVSNSGKDNLKVHVDYLNKITQRSGERRKKFFEENTSRKEIELLKQLCM